MVDSSIPPITDKDLPYQPIRSRSSLRYHADSPRVAAVISLNRIKVIRLKRLRIARALGFYVNL